MPDKKIYQHKKNPTSYHMQNPENIFNKLNIKFGNVFLDLGCGAGDYAIHASKLVGDSGMVYVLDKERKSIESFNEKIKKLKLKNIKTKIADITKELPFETNSIDICFVATVLHAIDFNKYKTAIFKEIYRILKATGQLTIVECSRKDLSFGPPSDMRLDPEKIEQSAKQVGFTKTNLIDLGFNYMIQLKKVARYN